jgi:hypothetical protein
MASRKNGTLPRSTDGARLPRRYEGSRVLGPLLEASACPLDPPGVAARFRETLAGKGSPDAAIAGLWEGEPRFPSPDQALRTYGNLLGLWDRLAAGLPAEPDGAGAEVKPERAAAPAPGPQPPGPLSEDFVEAAWRHLADLSAREIERLTHRYESAQPELFEFVRLQAGEDEAVLDNADTLVFELWMMFELASPGGKRRLLRRPEIEAAGDSARSLEPALERYIDEALVEAELADDQPLSAEQSARVGQIARSAACALSGSRDGQGARGAAR